MDVSGQIHAPAALASGKVLRYPLEGGGGAEPNWAFKKKTDMACSCGLKLQKQSNNTKFDGGTVTEIRSGELLHLELAC